MAPHLLVTNDFPPKVGGIQTYLWELWRRLPPGDVTVLTAARRGAAAFDADQAFRIERTKLPVLLPTRGLRRRIDALAGEVGAAFVVLDPAVPVGLLGPHLARPYVVIVHGSELFGRVPALGRATMGKVVAGAAHVVAAGNFPASEARRVAGRGTPAITVVPPGVDGQRFRPLSTDERAEVRRRFGIDADAQLVVAVSRLVPRKGFDVLIDAAARLRTSHPRLQVVIGGAGRDRSRLDKRIETARAPVRLLGRIPDGDLPGLYGSADLFAMCCRTRWLGLEPEGFGIVFLEAAACGVAQVAGRSGGAADAVADGETGTVVRRPRDPLAVSDAIASLLDDPARRSAMGRRSRERALADFDYDGLAETLAASLALVP